MYFENSISCIQEEMQHPFETDRLKVVYIGTARKEEYMLEGIETITMIEQTGTPNPLLIVGVIIIVIFVLYQLVKLVWKKKHKSGKHLAK